MRSDIKFPQPFASWSNSHAIFDRLEFFTPRCKLCELIIGHLFRWTMIQQKFQIFVNVKVVRPCHFNHCIDYSTGIGSFYRITEQPVLPANCKRTDRVLAEIVCETTAAILQKGKQVLKNAEFIRKSDIFLCRIFTGIQMLFYSALSAFGWSISIPDISQSNSRQERFRTCDCFLGH